MTLAGMPNGIGVELVGQVPEGHRQGCGVICAKMGGEQFKQCDVIHDAHPACPTRTMAVRVKTSYWPVIHIPDPRGWIVFC